MMHDPNFPRPEDGDAGEALLRALFAHSDAGGAPARDFSAATMAKVRSHQATWQAVRLTLAVIALVGLSLFTYAAGPTTLHALNQSLQAFIGGTSADGIVISPKEALAGLVLLGAFAGWLYAEKA